MGRYIEILTPFHYTSLCFILLGIILYRFLKYFFFKILFNNLRIFDNKINKAKTKNEIRRKPFILEQQDSFFGNFLFILFFFFYNLLRYFICISYSYLSFFSSTSLY